MRSEEHYWNTIEALEMASPGKNKAKIVKNTGISCLPMCATSQAFLHPSFFPLDPFHLFYENCMAFIWVLWMKSQPTDLFYIPSDKLKRCGELVAQASLSTLPTSFCGSVHDPFLKHYTNWLHHEIVKFLEGFQALYVGNDPTKISRARLCIFQFIHVSQHIAWNGSIRLSSQATCERTIGEMSCRIQSRKAVFPNLSNRINERELLKLMLLYYPTLDSSKKNLNSSWNTIKVMSIVRILQWEKVPGITFAQHMDKCTSEIIRWGKVCIGKGIAHQKQSNGLNSTIWGEAQAYYEYNKQLFVYRHFLGAEGHWSTEVKVLEVSNILNKVATFSMPETQTNVWIIQKHPGLAMLNAEETGETTDKTGDDDSSSDDDAY
ncbi:hypothetical protein L208DRAFT_1512578 [Tricholoma matsutake]|nr:hypothetical protein L208DRAFT_1512578 [Tricholoma matsutake 945]